MIERLKSILLAALVACSLWLTWQLWYAKPTYQSNEGQYTYLPAIGEPRTAEELLRPQLVIWHDGTGRHRLAYPRDALYQRALHARSSWRLGQAEEMDYRAWDWGQMRQAELGLEMRYAARVPAPLALSVTGEPSLEEMALTRLWLSQTAQGLYLYLIDDLEEQLWRLEVDGPELDTWSILANILPEATLWEQGAQVAAPFGSRSIGVYLPLDSLEVEASTWSLREIPLELLHSYFFVDPGYVREISQQDGTVLYTDGSRSVRWDPGRMQVTLDVPMRGIDRSRALAQPLLAAISFVNQRGGWNGSYQLEGDALEETLRFRQTLDGYPLLGEDGVAGWVELELPHEGGVTSYTRSLLTLSRKLGEEVSRLPGGERLAEALLPYREQGNWVALLPAYQLVREDQQVQLVPVWALREADGRLVRVPLKGEE